MPRYRLTLEYDGGPFQGWQRQSSGPSVQASLEEALEAFCGERTQVVGAGRTDAGVHALGQVANFFCDQKPDLHRLQRGLNALTADDITIKAVEIVPDAFDARRTMYQTFTLGYGHHECLGRAIATVMIPEIVRQALLLPNLRATGPVEWKYGVPEHYPLAWDA